MQKLSKREDHEKLTIVSIAKELGVHYATVSRALADSPEISEERKRAIKALAFSRGYSPNANASLRSPHTTIGMVVPALGDPFFTDVAEGTYEVAQDQKPPYSLFISFSNNTAEGEMQIIETLHRRRVTGILTGASRITGEFQDRLERIKIPTVLINSRYPSLHWVANDDRYGEELAVRHLMDDLGHRAIGYLGVKSRPESNRQRFEGYRAVMQERGLFREELAFIAPNTTASIEEDLRTGQTSLQRFLDLGVTAVVCYNDMAAAGLLQACWEKAVPVPGRLSVIGYDDVTLSAYSTPPLTTVRQAKKEIGRQATKMLLSLIEGRPVENISLRPDLVVRASTAPPHHQKGG